MRALCLPARPMPLALLVGALASAAVAFVGVEPVAPESSHGRSALVVLLWGPALETALMLAFAALFRAVQRRTRAHDSGLVASTILVGSAFVAAHVIQNGPAALVSAPMAYALAAGAAYAVRVPRWPARAALAGALILLHAMYNGIQLVTFA